MAIISPASVIAVSGRRVTAHAASSTPPTQAHQGTASRPASMALSERVMATETPWKNPPPRSTSHVRPSWIQGATWNSRASGNKAGSPLRAHGLQGGRPERAPGQGGRLPHIPDEPADVVVGRVLDD